ncbi:hypothetical protein NQ317_016252 [Molorchus minor]|uniref:Tyr recombinase domain-containing protein n=1 Tax=Molorchus minor TaxID=1323400 RepID=A0ABQ9K0N0_9CUCU|nr:hypothetical protein NQ317_016252 [Molorchus minor]
MLYATYIASKESTVADEQSRMLYIDSECSLNNNIYLKTASVFGKPDIDLFASRLNNKCDDYVSWMQDQGAVKSDAFAMMWDKSLNFYTFPPFAIIGRILKKIVEDRSMGRESPEDALPLMVNSISKSTLQQYCGTFRKWWAYCMQQKIDVYTVTVGSVIFFLKEIFSTKVSYATLNSHKSALALILDISNSDDILIKRFLKGAFRERPSFPRYNETWDPFIVLNYIKEWYPLKNLSLEKLVKKLVVLIALASGQRIQTISKINIKNIKINKNSVDIYFTDMLKTSSKVSQSIRKEESYLILTYRKPCTRASTQSISRWIKDVMRSSGIDTTIFKSLRLHHAY